MTRLRSLPTVLAASTLLALTLLTGCAPEEPAPGASGSSTPGASPSASATTTPSPTPSATADAGVPTDCRAILTAEVIAEFGDVPLNDPAWGATGVQQDGSLTCIWAQPGAADSTSLTTVISRMNRGPALELMNGLVTQQAFTCYQPDAGTRCEKQWPNATHPVTDGRTLYWRDDILIDTTYSNLSPAGYTATIVASIFG